MQLAMVAAGFTAGEADQLRRAMAAWRRNGELERFERRLIDGMTERGYDREFAERLFNQIQGFGEYGFPESHAASFALLVYVSAWLKHHEPAAFCCALLNSQPMGFYAPQQLVRSAREHGVEVRPVDVNRSDYESTLERREDLKPALRLGLEQRQWPIDRGRQARGRGARGAERSPRYAISPNARRSARRISAHSRRPARCKGSRAIGIARVGMSRGSRSLPSSWPRCGSMKRCRCCGAPRSARTSRPTIGISTSRSAAIRSPCCAQRLDRARHPRRAVGRRPYRPARASARRGS